MNGTCRTVLHAAALLALVAAFADDAISGDLSDDNHYILCDRGAACTGDIGTGVVATAFQPTGTLNTGRASHTATLLPSGKVLVAGGQGACRGADDCILSSAEIYDPATGVWSPTGSLKNARAGHTATLLPDGRVLVIGGERRETTMEVYDPSTGSWTFVALLVNHWLPGFTASLLTSGEVLIAGGGSGSRDSTLYDPSSGAFSPTNSLQSPRTSHTATLLRDGRVLVTGGEFDVYVDDIEVLSSTELYDPIGGTWTSAANLNMALTYHVAVLLTDGRVLVLGGPGPDFVPEIYDPDAGTWSETAKPSQGRVQFAATPLPNGQVMISGGATEGPTLLAGTEIYDERVGSWRMGGDLITPRLGHTATLLADGRVLVTGGVTLEGAARRVLGTSELYGPASPLIANGTIVRVIEYYNEAQDHYFITWLPEEIAKLDAGVQIEGWHRTGYSFLSYAKAQPGTSDICRFYIPPAAGDSHFYGRGTAECAATASAHPDYTLEDPNFMAMFLPLGGVCPLNTTEVYRAFDNRPDGNHRYTTDKGVLQAMVDKGWLAEGDGPNFVVMCAPQQ